MSNIICFDRHYMLFGLICTIIIIFIGMHYYVTENCGSYKDQIKKVNSRIDNINTKKTFNSSVILNPNSIYQSPQQINSLDRIYNPLRYPYRSQPYYNQFWYPNLNLPPQVIGGGARNIPTLGGTQIPISNPMVPINVSNSNIAPINISTRGPLGQPQQVGAIYKVFGNNNEVYPLYGRRKYPNSNKWNYYTTIGNYGVKMPIITPRKWEELGNNDIVFIKGKYGEKYKVNMYDNDFPQYIPY